MIKTLVVSLVALGAAVAASSAFSMTADADLDTNGDGVYSIEELRGAYPDMSDEMFVAIDANADGLVDMDEMSLATENGLLPVTDG